MPSLRANRARVRTSRRARVVALAGAALAGAALATGCADDPTATGGPPASLVVVEGDGQTGAPLRDLARLLSVRALASDGTPVRGVAVSWTAEGGGRVLPVAPTTDGDGRASAAWTLGDEATAQSASATAGGLAPARFSAFAVGLALRCTPLQLRVPANGVAAGECRVRSLGLDDAEVTLGFAEQPGLAAAFATNPLRVPAGGEGSSGALFSVAADVPGGAYPLLLSATSGDHQAEWVEQLVVFGGAR